MRVLGRGKFQCPCIAARREDTRPPSMPLSSLHVLVQCLPAAASKNEAKRHDPLCNGRLEDNCYDIISNHKFILQDLGEHAKKD